jgi:hypothetical protein
MNDDGISRSDYVIRGPEHVVRHAPKVSHSGRLPWNSPTHAVRQILGPLQGKPRRSQARMHNKYILFLLFDFDKAGAEGMHSLPYV